jgi:dTDP-4-amino-4,6-dideoxygalactose transaminase
MTDNAELAAVLKSVRVHGEGRDKYDNVRVGMNGRLDTLQAAILIEKLRIFRDEIEQRDQIAMRYNEQLAAVARVPRLMDGVSSVWAQYTIRVPSGRRGALAAALKARGIPTAVFYAKPLHQQTAYQNCLVAGNGLPVTERIAGEVISLPMHAYLDESDQQRIIEAVKAELD